MARLASAARRWSGIAARIVVVTAIAACARGSGPRPIATGTPCARCGMPIQDLRYACEDARPGAYRTFDAIECLLRMDPPAPRRWLADYDTRALHAADSMW